MRLGHLGVHIDTVAMKLYIAEGKRTKMMGMSEELMQLAQRNWRWVSLEKLLHFCGMAVSLTLALLIARFYTRSLYLDMSLAEGVGRKGRAWQEGVGGYFTKNGHVFT